MILASISFFDININGKDFIEMNILSKNKHSLYFLEKIGHKWIYEKEYLPGHLILDHLKSSALYNIKIKNNELEILPETYFEYHNLSGASFLEKFGLISF